MGCENKPNDRKGIRMALQTYSASRIKTYKKCPRLYYHKYIVARSNRPEEDKTVATLMGSALHTAIELRYRSNVNPVLTFQQHMDNTIESWEKDGSTIKGMDYYAKSMKTGTDILRAFRWEQFNPIALEYNFTLPFPNKEAPIVLINGIIDLIDMTGMIVDHKSASALPNQDELDNDIQFILYYWAYDQIHGEYPWKVVWNHLRTGKLIEADITKNYAMKIEQLTQDIQSMLRHSTVYARKEMDMFCRTICSFYTLCYGER